MPLETINYLLALAVMILQVLTVGFLAVFFLHKKIPDLAGIANFLSKQGLWIAFALSFAASAMTLVYSDVLGIAACIMCWWQRIFLYPQIIVLGVAAWKKDRDIAFSSILLSMIGGGIALYQHLLRRALPLRIRLHHVSLHGRQHLRRAYCADVVCGEARQLIR